MRKTKTGKNENGVGRGDEQREIYHRRLVLALDHLPRFGIELLDDEDAALLGEALPDVIYPNEELQHSVW
jgi:hypothetical protein